MATLSFANVRVGAQPINWINDDFKDLGASTSLDDCLREMREAGYEGSELGHRFSESPDEIRAALEKHGLRLVSGWHSTFTAERGHDDEERAFVKHARKLQACGCDVVIVAECTLAIHGDGTSPLRFAPGRELLSPAAWDRMCTGLDRLARVARSMGMRAAYHPHMGTVVQDASDVDALMAQTTELSLLLDAGHLAFAGADPLAVLEKHAGRVAHFHAKNIRPAITAEARARGWTFEQSVRAGAFTVPGDAEGGVPFEKLFGVLERNAYRGWIVVEAEQDPMKANPLEFAKRGRAFIRSAAGV
jgi:inosose dehydratase